MTPFGGVSSPHQLLGPPPGTEVPRRRQDFSGVAGAAFVVGPLASSFAAVWLLFHFCALSAPLGEVVCTLVLFVPQYTWLSWALFGPVVAKDRLAAAAVWAGSALALLPLALILVTTFSKGLHIVFRDFPRFLDTDASRFNSYSLNSVGGVSDAIVGTVEQVGLAGAMSVPVAVLSALFLHNAPGRVAGTIRALIDAMTSVPTIIASLVIYFLWVVPYGFGFHHGKSGLAVAFALAIIMMPTVAAASEAVLRVVPGSLREASYALGATEWRTVLRVIVPTARAGLISAVILGMARAAGETAPALFTSGDYRKLNANAFSGLQTDLPLRIFELHNEAGGKVAIPVQWACACVLVAIVLIMFVIARIVGAGSPLRRLRQWRASRRRSAPVVAPALSLADMSPADIEES